MSKSFVIWELKFHYWQKSPAAKQADSTHCAHLKLKSCVESAPATTNSFDFFGNLTQRVNKIKMFWTIDRIWMLQLKWARRSIKHFRQSFIMVSIQVMPFILLPSSLTNRRWCRESPVEYIRRAKRDRLYRKGTQESYFTSVAPHSLLNSIVASTARRRKAGALVPQQLLGRSSV